MREYLEKIDYSKPGSKTKMNDLFEMAMCSLEDTDPKLHEHIKCEMYELINGKKIDEYMAEEWIESMEPKAKWTKGQISSVASSYNLAIPLLSAYVIMNMLHSDSSNIYGDGNTAESIDKYVQGTKNWYFDSDAIDGEEKLYNYYKYIVKKRV